MTSDGGCEQHLLRNCLPASPDANTNEGAARGVWSLSTHTGSLGSMNLGLSWMEHEFWLHHVTIWPCDLVQAYFRV